MADWVHEVVSYAAVGLQTTLYLSLAAAVISTTGGFVLGALAATFEWFARLLWVYSQLWRGLPVLVTLFMVFFLLPELGVFVDSSTAVILGLSLWGSANVAEIVYGAIRSIPASQRVAAAALGFKPVAALAYVIVPQTIKRVLPSTVTTLVVLVQATSLASAIGAVDLLEAVNRSVSRLTVQSGESHAFPIYGGVLLTYFIICFPLTRWARRLERRFS